jgi:hypothetical protein
LRLLPTTVNQNETPCSLLSASQPIPVTAAMVSDEPATTPMPPSGVTMTAAGPVGRIRDNMAPDSTRLLIASVSPSAGLSGMTSS